ncbi:MAG TPA: tetratricopeptide repeat protein [Pyrinomonadaceae bacterium]|nr:tetratricopeptide repeat protein [Pyrinomonadaceae bacterium]
MLLRKARALTRAFWPYLSAPLLALLASAAAATTAPAQVGGIDPSGTGGRHSVQGRLMSPAGTRTDLRLKVRLESTGFGDLWVYSDANGYFKFQSLKAGTYTIIIEGGDYFETHRENVFIEPGNVSSRRGTAGVPISRPITLQIYLRPKRDEALANLARPGVINAALASVPKPAADLYQKALAAERRGDNSKAIEHLKATVQLHPDFPLALSKLGVLYLVEKQPEKAADSLRSALKLMPDDYVTLLSYGRALFDRAQFAEAEEQFRKAARKNNASPSAHFYIGLIMLKRRDLDGAEQQLRKAVELGGNQIAIAHYYLGGIYWDRRAYARAADELETYLRLTPEAQDAPRIRATIKELRGKK